MLVMKPSRLTSPSTLVNADPLGRKDTHVTKEDSPERPGINAQTPDSMPRAEDDEIALKKTYWEAYQQWPREIELTA